MRLNSCPVDNQQMEFFGISRRFTGKQIVTDEGEEVPEIERLHWSYCTKDATHLVGSDFYGNHVSIRPPFTKDELKSLFPSSREA